MNRPHLSRDVEQRLSACAVPHAVQRETQGLDGAGSCVSKVRSTPAVSAGLSHATMAFIGPPSASAPFQRPS